MVGGGSRSTRLGKEKIVVGVEDKSDLPNVDPPYPAYPGPFNPTTIQYALSHRSDVILTIFNTLGQQVTQPVNGDIDTGYHEVQFNTSGLASGVYFYRLQAGDFVQTKRLLLLKVVPSPLRCERAPASFVGAFVNTPRPSQSFLE